MSRAYIAVACVLIVAVSGLAACSNATGDKAQTLPVTTQAPEQNPRYLAADLPLLPPQVAMGVRPVTIMRATYEFAARHPEVMKFIPCFCGCERGGHKDNHDCFVSSRNDKGVVSAWDTHGIGCEICVDVAYQTLQMHTAGTPVADIRDAIEKRYAGHGGGHTATPLPKRGGPSHD